MRSALGLAGLAVLASANAQAAEAPSLSPAAALSGTAGSWTGELQYRDYQSNTWRGLPMTVKIAVQPDGMTMIRTASFDDGPTTAAVWITTVSQYDPASGKQSYAAFRSGRAVDTGSAALAMPASPRDATHWTIVLTEQRIDGDSQAQVRETMTRDGAVLTTLKEVNPLDDGKDAWLPRNRTILKLDQRVR